MTHYRSYWRKDYSGHSCNDWYFTHEEGDEFPGGMVIDFAIWSGPLTKREIELLGLGLRPYTVNREKLLEWYPEF